MTPLCSLRFARGANGPSRRRWCLAPSLAIVVMTLGAGCGGSPGPVPEYPTFEPDGPRGPGAEPPAALTVEPEAPRQAGPALRFGEDGVSPIDDAGTLRLSVTDPPAGAQVRVFLDDEALGTFAATTLLEIPLEEDAAESALLRAFVISPSGRLYANGHASRVVGESSSPTSPSLALGPTSLACDGADLVVDPWVIGGGPFRVLLVVDGSGELTAELPADQPSRVRGLDDGPHSLELTLLREGTPLSGPHTVVRRAVEADCLGERR